MQSIFARAGIGLVAVVVVAVVVDRFFLPGTLFGGVVGGIVGVAIILAMQKKQRA